MLLWNGVTVDNVETSYFTQLKMCYLMTTFRCPSDILITSWLFTACCYSRKINNLMHCTYPIKLRIFDLRRFHAGIISSCTNTAVIDQTKEESIISRIRRRCLCSVIHTHQLPAQVPAYAILRVAVDARSGAVDHNYELARRGSDKLNVTLDALPMLHRKMPTESYAISY